VNYLLDGKYPKFQLAIAGKSHGGWPTKVTGFTLLPNDMALVKEERLAEKAVFEYLHEQLHIKVIVEMHLYPNLNIVRQLTKVVNEGKEPVVITHISSAYMQGVCSGGQLLWNDANKVKVNYCLQSWEGEGQWRSATLEDLGLYPTRKNMCAGALSFGSVGSWSTGKYLPMAVIEDKETNRVWYSQIETSASWHYEMGYKPEHGSEGLFIHCDGASERNSGWTKSLLPGECLEAVPCAIGCCDGDINDAIEQLTKYRRTALLPEKAWKEGYCPVVFNDYMNCLWAMPTVKKLLPVIDKASAVGAEAFCIDAGWFGEGEGSWNDKLGDWYPNNELFGEKGLKGIIDYINTKGMRAGVWLELECAGETSVLSAKSDDWFLMKDGKRFGGGDRQFLNFANSEVIEYFNGIFDSLIGIGISYFKCDYNASIGVGAGANGDNQSVADGLLTHTRAFYAFIEQLKKRYPMVILENCASGAMRADYGMLSRMHLQSFSDVEKYDKCPAILSGMLAAVLPEQLGIWAYPYPLLVENAANPDVLAESANRELMADGEQSVFSMISGMCGNMYLSGRVDYADDVNFGLIQEGVSLYKKERAHIHNAVPVWPIGFHRLSDEINPICLGLLSEDKKRMLLMVWKLRGDNDIAIPLGKWINGTATAKQIYPAKGYDVDFCLDADIFKVTMPKEYQARVFEICFE